MSTTEPKEIRYVPGYEPKKYRCSSCHLEVGKIRKSGICRECYDALDSRDKNRSNNIGSLYGITMDQYDFLVSMPCFLCGTINKRRTINQQRRGGIRGVLCRDCSALVEKFDTVPGMCEKAASFSASTFDLSSIPEKETLAERMEKNTNAI